MECVITVKFFVHFNNELMSPIKPSCGLGQGDPLSPYLFFFIADGLSCILNHEITRGALHELKVCRLAPGVSHLLFAYDTLLFFKANEEQALVINNALRRYDRCTGQLINPAKCCILFGAACMDRDKERIKEILCLSKDKFRSTKEKLMVQKFRFNNWAERNMSSGAKEVLIKAVAQAIPAYTMGVFKLPTTLCDEMIQLIRYFW
jgi:hypothetical protein